ncbi:Acyl-CoA dehydrogenase family member [Paramyrothecium foliicola]|nr:Acyl-CoA dehydrogenase family member [Paramyrothecium foliicola]
MADGQPKVLLFDIGGVCVKSPFQSILDYERQLGIPPGWINYSISKTAPNGYWHRIERGDITMDASFFQGFSQDLHDPVRWEAFYKREQSKNPSLPREVPPLPNIDAEFLFHEMMSAGDYPDPWMYPALKNLKADGRYIIAALSNTVIFPPGHRFHVADFFDDPLRKLFDVFISSAHVGIRKPDPKMYQLALKEVNQFALGHADDPRGQTFGWREGVGAKDIVFLDDIGENLREAKKQGFRTIKVPLGRAFEAVEELEKVTGLRLAGDHPTISGSAEPSFAKAKI